MTEQYGRKYSVQIDDIFFDGLDIEFNVVKTLKKEPNTLVLKIYNLEEEKRRAIEEKKNPIVQLSAGYEDNIAVIFLGDVRDAGSAFEVPDWVTTLESGDGERATRFDRVNRAFRAGTSLETILRETAKAMNIGEGNLNRIIKKGRLIEAAAETNNGMVVSGSASREMDRLVRSAGLEWSIQDNTFQVLEAGKTLPGEAVVLTPNTGLIGSPTIDNDGILQFTALLNPEIIPGRQLQVKSLLIDSRFRVERAEYTGTVDGNDWYVSGEAKELKL